MHIADELSRMVWKPRYYCYLQIGITATYRGERKWSTWQTRMVSRLDTASNVEIKTLLIKAQGRRQKAEGGRQKPEGGRRKAVGGRQ